MFPIEYGGPVESMQQIHGTFNKTPLITEIIEIFADVHRGMVEKHYVKWVDEEELFLMDMSKRPKQVKKPCFIASSFKSLTID